VRAEVIEKEKERRFLFGRSNVKIAHSFRHTKRRASSFLLLAGSAGKQERGHLSQLEMPGLCVSPRYRLLWYFAL